VIGAGVAGGGQDCHEKPWFPWGRGRRRSAASGTFPAIQDLMPITMVQEADRVFRIAMNGLLRKPDLDRCQARLASEMRRLGPVRLLFVLEGFEGWEPADNWSDLTFYAKYGDCIDRIAIVGEERWRSEALMFAGDELRRAPVEYFARSAGDETAARAWLAT
jgi:hypothetical protein